MPVRSLDLIGFGKMVMLSRSVALSVWNLESIAVAEFLTLLQDEVGTIWPPSPPPPRTWGGNRKPCGDSDNKTGTCLDFNQMHMQGEKAVWCKGSTLCDLDLSRVCKSR